MAEQPDVRCAFWMERKRKYCSFRPIAGITFCGNHRPDGAKRVPCPVDPGQYVALPVLHTHQPLHTQLCIPS